MNETLVGDADHVQLSRLVTEISWRIDHGQADTVHELFVEDGELDRGAAGTVKGREALRAWGLERDKATHRTQHVCTNMRFVATGDNTASGTSVLTVFQVETSGLGTAIPFAVGEDLDEFVRTDQGWRFVSRTFEMKYVRPAS